jgi:hypothetical protein
MLKIVLVPYILNLATESQSIFKTNCMAVRLSQHRLYCFLGLLVITFSGLGMSWKSSNWIFLLEFWACWYLWCSFLLVALSFNSNSSSSMSGFFKQILSAAFGTAELPLVNPICCTAVFRIFICSFLFWRGAVGMLILITRHSFFPSLPLMPLEAIAANFFRYSPLLPFNSIPLSFGVGNLTLVTWFLFSTNIHVGRRCWNQLLVWSVLGNNTWSWSQFFWARRKGVLQATVHRPISHANATGSTRGHQFLIFVVGCSRQFDLENKWGFLFNTIHAAWRRWDWLLIIRSVLWWLCKAFFLCWGLEAILCPSGLFSPVIKNSTACFQDQIASSPQQRKKALQSHQTTWT